MKKLLIAFLFCSFGAMAQDTVPADTAYHALPTYSFKYYTKDSSVWIYKGSKYQTTKLVSNKRLKFLLDSINGAFISKDQTVPDTMKNGSVVTEGIQFDTTPTTTNAAEGLLRWNATDGTLDLGVRNGLSTQQMGQEIALPAYNLTGVTIAEGIPVYITGRHGTMPTVAPAKSDAIATSNVFGVTTTTFGTTGDLREGLVTTLGYVRGIKTNYTGSGAWGTTWVENDKLYASKSVAGQLTNVEPANPHHADVVATVAIIGAVGTGSILVLNEKHTDLVNLSDVNGTPLSYSGQFPVWDQTNKYFDFTKNANGLSVYHGIETIGVLSFDNTSHVFTVASGGLTYWNQGHKHTSTTAKTVDLDDTGLVTNKLYYIYFSDTTGVLRASVTPWQWHNHTFVATLYWNGSQGAIQDEDHNHTRNIDWQIWAHSTIGTRYRSGLSLSAPTTAADASLSIQSGTIQDEDHTITISAQATMRGWYPVSPTVYTFTNYSLPYLGTTGAPRFLDTDTYTLETFPANRFAVYWVYASNDQDVPIYIIPSKLSQTYTTLALARAELAPDLINIPINSEMKIIYKLIYSGDGEFVESADYRGSSPLPAGGSSSTTAGAVSFAPYGTISSTTVQKALEEFNDSTFKNLTQYYVPKYNDKNFIKSKIYDNGKVHINGTAPDSMLTVTGGGHFTTGLKLDQPQGKAPLTISSTTVNTNLNADLLDGLHGSDYVPATRTITATAPITIDGTTSANLSANRTIAISSATTTTAGSMSGADKLKLDGIATGAEVNVNADWNAVSGDAQILNKPTLTSGTVTSVAALTLGTSGTDLSSTVANSSTTPTITLNVPTASATNRGVLSSTDWSTFNSKQPAGTYSTDIHSNITALNNVSGVNTGDQDLSGLAPISGGVNYIQNQNSSAQSANMWIDGDIAIGSVNDSKLRVTNTTASKSLIRAVGVNGSMLIDNAGSGNNYFNASQSHDFQINGVNKFLINANGTANFASTVSASNGQLIGGSGTTGYLPIWTNGGNKVIGDSPIYSEGTNIGVGTISPNYTSGGRRTLDISGSNSSLLGFSVGGVASGYIYHSGIDMYLSNDANGVFAFNTNAAIRMTISASGITTIGSLGGTGSRMVFADNNGALSATNSSVSPTFQSVNLTTGAAINKVWQCTNATTGAGQWASVSTTQTYVSTWDASTNTPTLANGVGTNGYYHRVNVAGTQNLGSGNITFNVGDNVVYNSSGVWQRDPAPTIVGNALTKTDDTNVTLTLGGSPATSLLNAASIAVGWTGTLADGRIASASTWNAKESALTFGTGLNRTGNTITNTITNTNQLVNGAGYLTSDTKWDGGSTGLTAATGRTSLGLGGLSTTNISVQALSGTAVSWNCTNGINATLTLSGTTTVTLSNVTAGTSGNIKVTNAVTAHPLTFALSGKTVSISPAVYVSAGRVLTSGGSKLDVFSWYYDGTNLIINGTNDYK